MVCLLAQALRVARGWGRPAACSLVAIGLTSLAPGQELQYEFDALRQRTELGAATMSAIAIDADSGQVLWSHRAGEAMIPASNMKLLTSGAALMVLGPEFSFETRLEEAEGRLVLVGSGDPSLGDPAVLGRGQTPMTLQDLLGGLVKAVQERGISQVEEVVVDDRVFDRAYAHPTWPADQLNRSYCAEVGGVNLHANVLSVFLEPGSGGRGLPRVKVEPEVPWVQIDNFARTVTDTRQTAWVARPTAENRFQIRGDVRSRGGEPVDVAFHEPPLLAGRVIAHELSKAGIRIGTAGGAEGIDAVRLIDDDEQITGSQPIVVVRTSIADVLRQCNTDSHNLYAEALLKRVAYDVNHEPGSWESGAAVVRMLLSEKLGPAAASGTKVADGSGMSRENKVSASTLASWLRVIENDEKIRGAMLASLATPGNGTLRSRFNDITLSNELYAKSGYLNGVRSLSGYVVSPSGKTVIFAMILNDVPAGAPTQNARVLLERCVDVADNWLAAQQGGSVNLGG
ncbi:MAG: D-alanyl-D-alanine carboxypeptidase/D-alanyl-D-alanine-endopeptidase [Leptolyngbya sp. PLA3]|nr:MAG: D-alanyl-D-alanine carboxypeptidase/D-alanyl-D-alanine-endopeptidase [Cyanobacteria bacterium CYA]MCE7967519.1 D-alanyl-D-alanine carboxypeptidase/D-alanyl-D-alanine-endopeptidase [Leptolyngbya sp. PL-A3]